MKPNLVFLFTLFAFSNCTNSIQKDTPTMTEDAIEKYAPLQHTLDERKKAWEAKASTEVKEIYQSGIEDIVKKGVLEKAKKRGDFAPNFALKNAANKSIELKEVLKNGPVILVWYRGGWCPYCNLTLHRLQEELTEFKKYKGQLLALTPELPDQSLSTKEKHHLSFEVLSDVGNNVARDYGVVFKLTPDVAQAYQEKFGLHEHNGDNSDELPLAATYVIDTNGLIQYAFLNADYRKRAEPRDILETLKKL